MAFSLCASRDIRKLSNRLAQDLKALVRHIDPFQPIYIVTQTVGMNIWLKSKLAEEMSISANLQFLTPTELLARIHLRLGGNPEESLSGESLTWILYRLLREEGFTGNPGFREAVAYMGDDKGKRLGLAEQLTDLFDQYQVYRHGMIETWNARANDNPSFQEYLWSRLKEVGLPVQDKTVLRKEIIDRLVKLDAETAASVLGPLRNLYFFGLSVFTPYHLDIIESLSAKADAKFYILNPAASDYWYEDLPERVIERWRHLRPGYNPQPGNDLLTNWGRVIQQTFRIFFERDTFLNVYESLDDSEVPPAAGTMLAQLQRQVTRNVTGRDKAFNAAQLEDGSIQVHACYTPAREVEALYNYLVGLVEKDPTLTGRDIIVSCDIDLYAPYIRAVFDSGPVKFRYAISDATYLEEDNPLKALLAILELSESGFNAETVMRLLDFTCIRKKFGIGNIELVHVMVREAMFRFGIEGETADDSYLFSLAQAIKKIVYGISMRIDGMYVDFYPLDFIEGRDSEDALRFCLFAETLSELVTDRADRTLEKWGGYIEKIMSSMLFEEDPEDEQQLFLQEMLLIQLGHYYQVSGFVDEKVPFRVFARSFSTVLSRERRMKQFLSQGITFCSHVPMRSIPFRVVCLLGMDFDKFPRQDQKPGFSLIDGKQPGDRSVREHDKHLFLESVMSARERLFISYIGNSVKDNSTIPPSVLVDELVNYIAERSDDPKAMRKDFIVRHPLHAFSNRYNAGDERLVNYLVDNRPQEIPMVQPDEQQDIQQEERVMNLDDLCAFFRNPVKYYYNKVLNIYYEHADDLLPVTEKFELNYLDKHILDKSILDEGLTEEDVRNKVIKGELPPGNIARMLVDIEGENILPLQQALDRYRHQQVPEEKEVDIPLENGLRLVGKVSSVYNDTLVNYSLSDSPRHRKYIMDFCLRYLALRASGHKVKGVFVRKDGACHQAVEIDAQRAEDILKELIHIHLDHEKSILAFYPELNYTHIPELLAPGMTEESIKGFAGAVAEKIEGHFEDLDGIYDHYGLNAYKKGVFDQEGFHRSLVDNMRKIYGSLVPHILDIDALK